MKNANVRIDKRLIGEMAANRNVRAFFYLVGTDKADKAFISKFANQILPISKEARAKTPLDLSDGVELVFSRFSRRLVPVHAEVKKLDSPFQTPTHIIIHEADAEFVPAESRKNMDYYEDLINSRVAGKENYARGGTGFHYIVSDQQVIQFIEDFESTHHAANVAMNFNAVGIERLVNVDVDQPEAIYQQAKLTATLMVRYAIPLEHVKRHSDVGKTACPARLNDGQYGGWDGFLSQVLDCLQKGDVFPEKFTDFSLDQPSFHLAGAKEAAERFDWYQQAVRRCQDEDLGVYATLFPDSQLTIAHQKEARKFIYQADGTKKML